MTKTQKKFVRRFATVFFPQESAVFYPDGNSPGKTMENSGKQNPERGFKSPPEHLSSCC
jgi:hypothetical protein